MKVPLLDLTLQYESIRHEIEPVVQAVMASQQFILGRKVEECERELAAYCGTAHAVGVSSGTDALLLSLMAEGVGPGDEVITTPFTFFATAGSIARLGARPVFVDIDPATYNIDVSRIEAKVNARTKAIIPVHLFGQMADMTVIMNLAGRHGLAVIEDAAQAIGAEDQGRRAGSIGHTGCFSFFPSKNLGAFGDAGLVTAQDAERAERLTVLRGHGMKPKYHHKWIGGNFRIDALQAAIISVKLRHLDTWTEARQCNARRYLELFAGKGLLRPDAVQTPKAVKSRHVFNQFIVRVPRRDEARAFLADRGIGTEVYYPVPLHLQECFAYLGYKRGDFPHSEAAALETLALPIFPELTEDQAEWVVHSLADFLGGGAD